MILKDLVIAGNKTAQSSLIMRLGICRSKTNY